MRTLGTPAFWLFYTLFAVLLTLNPGYSTAAVEIEGLDKAQKKNVLAWLSINRLAQDASALSVQRRHRRADKEIRNALQALGYYSPQIKRELHIGEDSWVARYRIDPGPRTLIKSVAVEFSGPGAVPLQQGLRLPALQGKGLHHDEYRTLKEQLLNAAFGAGYLDAELTHSLLLIDPPNASASIQLQLDSGLQYLFGQIHIEQDILKPEFLKRYVQIETDSPFNVDSLLALQLRLSDLDYFQSLDVTTQRRETGDPHIDVRIQAEAKPPQRYQFGFGYGTDTGPRFSLNSEFRRLNRSGHRLRGDLRFSPVQRLISARYLIPTGQEIGTNWAVQSRYTDEKFADGRGEEYLLGLTRTRVVGSRLWQAYVNYEFANFSIAGEHRETTLLKPGLSLTLRDSDDALNPQRGYKLFLDMHGAREDFGSSSSFIQTLIRARLIWPLSQRSRLLLRGQSGISLVGEISNLPLSERFFAGGDQSVRGYAYQSLGPKDASGQVIGGEFLSLISIELDRLFYGNYGGAVFFDYGGASDEPGELLARGVGVGLRWRTAIGMVRADFAHPLDDPDGGFRVHIGIGVEL